ncbi:hypothetical protein Pmani_015644 [Petrolisthes manimaculis]|uniref:Uncharacterized protein n=1 Tax=Petrolisthes manimaculis TaxID=1843537 RepID=A0AAE1UBV5_9EUCA|nr:hypothetical protein Pmani_015644 [Petrolisthes manimaculis]
MFLRFKPIGITDTECHSKLLKKGEKTFATPLSAEVTTDYAIDPTPGPSDPVYTPREVSGDAAIQSTDSEHESAYTSTEEEVDTDETTIPSSQRTKPL